MNPEIRSHVHKMVAGVVERNRLRHERRRFFRKRRKLLGSIRAGIVKELQSALDLFSQIELPSIVEQDSGFGTTSIRSPGCPTLIFKRDGEYIGRDNSRKKPPISHDGQWLFKGIV